MTCVLLVLPAHTVLPVPAVTPMGVCLSSSVPLGVRALHVASARTTSSSSRDSAAAARERAQTYEVSTRRVNALPPAPTVVERINESASSNTYVVL